MQMTPHILHRKSTNKQIVTSIFVSVIFLLLPTSIWAQKINASLAGLGDIESLRTTNPQLAWHLAESLHLTEKSINYKHVPQHRFNFLFGRIASAMNRNNQAVDFFLKAFESDSVQQQSSQYIRTAYLLSEELLVIQDNERAMKYILLALEKSRSSKDLYNESVCLGILSKVYYFNDQYDKAYDAIAQAINILESNRNNAKVFSMDKLAIYRSVQADYYGYAGEHEKSIESVNKGLDLLKTENQNLPKGCNMDEVNYHYWIASFYAMLASQYQMLNQNTLAKLNADKAVALIKGYKILRIDVYYKILHYLINAKLYDEAILLTNFLKENQTTTDSINLFSQAYSDFLAQAYQGKGNFRNAYNFLRQYSDITNALNTKARAESSMELATVYETSKKDALLQANEYEIKRKNTFIVFLILGIIFFGIVSYLIWRNAKIIKAKNHTLYVQLKEQDLLYSELKRLKQEAPQQQTNETNKELSLFDKTEAYLLNTQAYTNADLTREMLAAELGSNRKYLCDAIQEAKGQTFNDYINSFRLDHARNMLYDIKHNPVIDDVLISSGFSNRSTFYRLFRQKFGLTPSELKELVKEEIRKAD
jgi:AraC-like DNA-binding protein